MQSRVAERTERAALLWPAPSCGVCRHRGTVGTEMVMSTGLCWRGNAWHLLHANLYQALAFPFNRVLSFCYPAYIGGNCSSEKLRDLLKVTQWQSRDSMQGCLTAKSAILLLLWFLERCLTAFKAISYQLRPGLGGAATHFMDSQKRPGAGPGRSACSSYRVSVQCSWGQVLALMDPPN
jgi:hypothetical protein